MCFKRDNKPTDGELGLSSDDDSGEPKPQLAVERMHDVVAHGHEMNNRETAKALGFKTSRGALRPCKCCAVAHVKQKAITENAEREIVTNIHALRDSSVNSWITKCLMTFLQKCTFCCNTSIAAHLCFLNNQSYLITASTVNFLHYQLNIKTCLKLATVLQSWLVSYSHATNQ